MSFERSPQENETTVEPKTKTEEGVDEYLDDDDPG